MRECGAVQRGLEVMSLLLLILFALGTTLPCIGLWLADEYDRLA
jgi:hypothetical protein